MHADFDWGGLSIVSRAIQTAGAQPWRYSPEDYRDAVTSVPTTELPQHPPPRLDARLAPLAQALRSGGRAVHEEAVIESLLNDLAELSRPAVRGAQAPTVPSVNPADRE